MRDVLRASVLSVATIGGITLASVTSSAEPVRIGGTGIGLAMMERIGESLSAANPSFSFKVLPSLGTPGGLKALAEDAVDVAITARDLNANERATGVREAVCVTTALIFATSHKKPQNLALADLPAIYANPAPKWPDGTPLKIILRSRAGSENPYLFKLVPGLEGPLLDAYKRRGMPVGATDQDNAELATQIAGSFAIMTLLQLKSEKLRLNILPVNGVVPSTTTLADQTYPMPVRVCLALRSNATADMVRLIEHLKSEPGLEILRSLELAHLN